MSLINDALKRAKHAHQNAAPTTESGPQLRPAEPAQVSAQSASLVGPITLGCILVIVVLLAIQWLISGSRGQPPSTGVVVRARTTQPAVKVPGVDPVAVRTTAAAASASPGGNAGSITSPSAVAGNAPAADSSVSTAPNETTIQSPPAETNVAAVVQPPPLRLQAILYSPQKPSAMIGGKTLYVGDQVRDLRVAAITRNSAVLIGGGRTNVLTLAE